MPLRQRTAGLFPPPHEVSIRSISAQCPTEARNIAQRKVRFRIPSEREGRRGEGRGRETDVPRLLIQVHARPTALKTDPKIAEGLAACAKPSGPRDSGLAIFRPSISGRDSSLDFDKK